MATTPRSKAATKQAIQAANPLDNIPSNLGNESDQVPDEFKAAPHPVEHDGISPFDRAAFEAWQAERAAGAAANADTGAQGLAVAPKPEFKTNISESGRAPKVEAKDRVWIILDDNDEIPPGGQFIGVNGVGYMLLAGVEAFVPRAVCEVLDHAIKSIPIQDANTKRVIGWRPRKRFPYTIVNRSADQVEA